MRFNFTYFRDFAPQTARRHGKAPLGAERHIRDAGEKASGLYGAETWVAMTGSRYEELNAKQGRMEREMLGMTKKAGALESARGNGD